MSTFQGEVFHWVTSCFGPEVATDKIERHHRFLEEALELVQATGCTKEEALQLVDYVFSRPVGEVVQEVGGTMVTLAALCQSHDVSMSSEGWRELSRINSPEIKARIRQKQALKPVVGPLPC